MALNDDTRLGCGHTLQEVWDGLDAEPTSHAATCPECQSARESLLAVRKFSEASRAGELDAESHPTDTDRPSSSVRNRVMDLARAEVGRARQMTVADTHDGPIRIGQQAVNALVRFSVDQTPGVRTRRVKLTGADEQHIDRISAHVGVSSGVTIPSTMEDVRTHVVRALQRHLNIDPSAVDLIVEDVYDG